MLLNAQRPLGPIPATSFDSTSSSSSHESEKDFVNVTVTDESLIDPEQQEQLDWKPTRQIWSLIAGQTCCVFVVALDATILTTALPTVARALNASTGNAFWIVASYLLASAVVQPITAALSDVFGRRSVFLSGLALFTIGTIICALSHNVGMLLVGRTIQGVGGGTILSVNLIILSDVLPLRQRSKYVGIVQGFNSIAINLGPIIGALLVKTSWRWLFFINLPFCVIGVTVAPFLLRYVTPKTTAVEKLGQIDWIGSALFVVGMTGLLIGVSWGGTSYAWNSAPTLVPLLGGAFVVCLTILYERFVAAQPFLRLSLFSDKSSIATYICTVIQSLILFCEIYFLTLALLTVRLYTSLLAGTVLLAFGLTVVPISAIVGAVITRLGRYRWALLTGWLLNTLGLGLLTLISTSLPTSAMIVIFIIAGTGQGILFMAQQAASQAAAPPRDVAYASAMFSFARSLGFSLGVALGGAIFLNFLTQQLHILGVSADIAVHAEADAEMLRLMAAGPEKDAIIAACAHALRMVFATMTGLSGLGLALSLLAVKEQSLDQGLDVGHVLRSAEVVMNEQA